MLFARLPVSLSFAVSLVSWSKTVTSGTSLGLNATTVAQNNKDFWDFCGGKTSVHEVKEHVYRVHLGYVISGLSSTIVVIVCRNLLSSMLVDCPLGFDRCSLSLDRKFLHDGHAHSA